MGNMIIELNKIYHGDCLELMKQLPDNFADWAMADPPYFQGPNKPNFYGKYTSKTGVKRVQYEQVEYWDIPTNEWYDEVLRVSKNQIIWGINYFEFAGRVPGRLIWDKNNHFANFSKAELASCSSINTIQKYNFTWNGFIQEDMKNREKRIHPTQKPVKLTEMILNDYTKEGDLILVTHSGSASFEIACKNTKRNFIGMEKSRYYYEKGNERLKNPEDFIFSSKYNEPDKSQLKLRLER